MSYIAALETDIGIVKKRNQMSKAQTYFQLHADIKVKPLMMKLPYAQMSGIEVLDTATWNTFEIEPMTRGY